MRVKKFLNELFTTTKAERNGALVLISLLCILIAFRLILPHISKPDIDQEEMDLIFSRFDSISKAYEQSQPIEKSESDIEYFPFDPNTVSRAELVALGIDSRVINTFLNYRKSGATFKKPDDILKVYGITHEQFKKLEPYIIIKQQEKKLVEKPKKTKDKDDPVVSKTQVKTYPQEKKYKYNPQIIDINTADTTQLKTLYGIGSVFAKRIVNFRNSLGGYLYIEQLKEVYGLSEETYQRIKKHVSVDSSRVNKININFASVDDLRKHPYCNYTQARTIINYRDEKGSFQTLDYFISDSVLVNAGIEKLLPYLSINQSK